LGGPFVLVVAAALVVAAVRCLYVLAAAAPSAYSEAVMDYGWGLALVCWADLDARRRGRLPCFDFGFLAMMFLPVAVAWYCVWSRGRRGWLVVLILLGLWCLPSLAAACAWVAVAALRGM